MSATDTPWPDRDIALLQEIYELTCTSRMNAIYYAKRLAALQKESFFMEVTTAVTASGSGVAALTLWNQGAGQVAWQALALRAGQADRGLHPPAAGLPRQFLRAEEAGLRDPPGRPGQRRSSQGLRHRL
jgi:hypothetical protein